MKSFLVIILLCLFCVNASISSSIEKDMNDFSTNNSFNGRFWNRFQSEAKIYLLGLVEYETFCYGNNTYTYQQTPLKIFNWLVGQTNYTSEDIFVTMSNFYKNPKYIIIPISVIYIVSMLYLVDKNLNDTKIEDLLNLLLLNINKQKVSMLELIKNYLDTLETKQNETDLSGLNLEKE